MFLFFLLLHLSAAAQYGGIALSNPYSDFGAYSQKQTPVTSVMANPAALASLKNTSAALRGERKFMLPELGHYMALVVLPTTAGTFGLSGLYAGNTDYNQSELSIAYGRRLGDKVQAGLQFRYNSIHISSGYGNASVVSATAGIIFHATDKLSAGFNVVNPVPVYFGINKEEKLPRQYSAGIGYEVSGKVLTGFSIIKEDSQPVTVNAGMQYRITTAVLVKAGISSAASTAWFGAGFSLRTFNIDVFSHWHPQLGISPGILLQWQLKKKAE